MSKGNLETYEFELIKHFVDKDIEKYQGKEKSERCKELCEILGLKCKGCSDLHSNLKDIKTTKLKSVKDLLKKTSLNHTIFEKIMTIFGIGLAKKMSFLDIIKSIGLYLKESSKIYDIGSYIIIIRIFYIIFLTFLDTTPINYFDFASSTVVLFIYDHVANILYRYYNGKTKSVSGNAPLGEVSDDTLLLGISSTFSKIKDYFYGNEKNEIKKNVFNSSYNRYEDYIFKNCKPVVPSYSADAKKCISSVSQIAQLDTVNSTVAIKPQNFTDNKKEIEAAKNGKFDYAYELVYFRYKLNGKYYVLNNYYEHYILSQSGNGDKNLYWINFNLKGMTLPKLGKEFFAGNKSEEDILYSVLRCIEDFIKSVYNGILNKDPKYIKLNVLEQNFRELEMSVFENYKDYQTIARMKSSSDGVNLSNYFK